MPLMAAVIQHQLPNALTVLRLLIAAAFFGTLTLYRYPQVNVVWANVAIALFLVGVFTDFLDGYLARKWKVESVFGRMMDPFCDKVLVIGAFIYLAGPRFVIPDRVIDDAFLISATGVYSWMVVVILARELLVTTIRGEMEAMGASGAAMLAGKLKMILQSITIPFVLFTAINIRPTYPELTWLYILQGALVYVTVIVTAWSAAPYISALRRLLARSQSSALAEDEVKD